MSEKNILINNINVFAEETAASKAVAMQIKQAIEEKQSLGQPIILGLATGNTPKLVYHELVNMHKNEGLSFENVITFNLDEYYPMAPSHQLSYHNFMNMHLFSQVNILPENIHIPHGQWKAEELIEKCEDYERKIQELYSYKSDRHLNKLRSVCNIKLVADLFGLARWFAHYPIKRRTSSPDRQFLQPVWGRR